VAWQLRALREAGAGDQAAAQLARDPAAHASLQYGDAVVGLMETLREMGAGDQPAALPATQASLEDPEGVSELLQALQEAGTSHQIVTLGKALAADTALPVHP
jgi:hypothetical protein